METPDFKYLNYLNNSEIKCPHCDHEFTDSWEHEESGMIECESCGEEFHVEVNVSVSYTTSKE